MMKTMIAQMTFKKPVQIFYQYDSANRFHLNELKSVAFGNQEEQFIYQS